MKAAAFAAYMNGRRRRKRRLRNASEEEPAGDSGIIGLVINGTPQVGQFLESEITEANPEDTLNREYEWTDAQGVISTSDACDLLIDQLGEMIGLRARIETAEGWLTWFDADPVGPVEPA